LPKMHSKKPCIWKRDFFSLSLLEEVEVVLSSKVLNEKFNMKASNTEDGLLAKGRSSIRDSGGVKW